MFACDTGLLEPDIGANSGLEPGTSAAVGTILEAELP